MNRRTFLRGAASLPALAVSSRVAGFVAPAGAQQKEFVPRPGTWRTFEITTRVEILEPAGVTRAWLPIPSVKSDFQKLLGDQWTGNAKIMKSVADNPYGANMLYAEFAAGEAAPVVELTSRLQTQDRATDWSKKVAADDDPAIVKMWTKSTDLIPTDGIVRETALEVTKGKTTDLEKVKAVYDWILANTYREPKVRGCGVGDIKTMLETKSFGGKCGDINGLFVGLVRSVGVPARGLRLQGTRRGKREHQQGAALPRGGLPQGLRVGGHGSRGRDEGGSRGNERVAEDRSSAGRGGAAQALRRMGRQLGRVQYGSRRGAAGRDPGWKARLLHVPAVGDGAGPPRQPRSRQFQVHDHHARNQSVTASARRAP
jgi:hypothetical protein